MSEEAEEYIVNDGLWKKYKHYKKPILILASILLIIIVPIVITTNIYKNAKVEAMSTIPSDGNIKLTVKLKDVELLYNDSVGNDWSYQSKINSTILEEGKEIDIVVNRNGRISIGAAATEHDSISETGIGGITVNAIDLNLTEDNLYPVEVTVTENRGRYSGHDAKWRFNFVIARKVSKAEIYDKIFSR